MSRGCDDNLIGWVAVKISRQTARIGSDVWSEIQKSHTGIGECNMEPLIGWQRQPESTSLHQFCYFPTGDCAETNWRVSCWAMNNLVFFGSRSSW